MRWAIRSFKSSAVDKGVSLGGSVLLYALIIVFAVMLFVISRYEKGMSLKNIGKIDPKTKQRFHLKNAFSDLDSATLLAFRMLYAGVIFTVFTGDNIFVRMAEYGLVFTIILIPNLISQLEIKSRFFTKYMVLGALGAYFYLYGVRANDLLCFPYKFFWNA